MAVFASRDPNVLTHEFYTGLLDTGATASWISRTVVERFGLESIGKKPVVVATEIRQRPAFYSAWDCGAIMLETIRFRSCSPRSSGS